MRRSPEATRPGVSALLLTALLALTACASPGGATAAWAEGLDPVSTPDWAQDMARFDAEDAAHPPPSAPVVFTGSSSVRMWETLARDFPEVPVLNRGFGGSQVRDAVWHADSVALRYRPRQIVLYAGDNDTAEGRTPRQVLDDTRRFVARVHAALPGTPVVLLGIKPSPSRAGLLPVQRETNRLLADWAGSQARVRYVDVFNPMLDADGRPREALFLADRLHMNADGYALWRELIRPVLVR
ncbi:SGNH/GDSL hydrolase family protein [Luteimonas deserti]|uniref:SGNH hydrolase-type esterase domain-containing protein n=1 Tax=Luteimonas deserti TaxID=2752306 RepID=A0A7Z0TTB2_9GAMM|nr:SGNH/GDSL hydrolase family protein [Luteimonas deserti]NYZ61626.1 hypothetical protein [Luteimonas deserti]